jgi:hypothetical protein
MVRIGIVEHIASCPCPLHESLSTVLRPLRTRASYPAMGQKDPGLLAIASSAGEDLAVVKRLPTRAEALLLRLRGQSPWDLP